MPGLKLIFSASSQTSLCLGYRAFLQKQGSAAAEPVFQGTPVKQTRELLSLGLTRHLRIYLRAKTPAEREKRLASARNWLDEFAREAEGKNTAWLFQDFKSPALPVLAQLLREHPVFSRYNPELLFLADEPLENLHWKMAVTWKTPAMDTRARQICNPAWPVTHAAYTQALASAFPEARLEILPANGELSTMPQIEHFLGASLPPWRFYWPRTFTGLDFWAAARGFPFGSLQKDYYDIWNFFAIIRQVEEEEGFEKFFHYKPQDKALIEEHFPVDDIASWSSAPREFMRERREKMLAAGDLPETLPLLTSAQCEKFIQALPDGLRIALLRHFRIKGEELSSEELVLAKGLENHRARNFPASPFHWPRPKPLVSVLTMTRNHRNFILDCMESVTMQRVDFPVEHIIVDDYSDDGTRDILDNYASTHALVRPIYLDRRSRGGSRVRTLFENCKSEFAALCDGDDYFRDPHKLSLQVDFLKKNPGCALCFHPVLVRHEDTAKKAFLYPSKDILPGGFRDFYSLEDLITGNFIQTNSVMYRWRFANGLSEWFRANLAPADWYWHLLHAEMGSIGFINKAMAVYRRHGQSYFATSLQGDSKEHRKRHGMKELAVFDELNRHFKNRFFPVLADLASGVLTDFVKMQMEDGDDGLLDSASEKYPEFTLNFLKRLSSIK